MGGSLKQKSSFVRSKGTVTVEDVADAFFGNIFHGFPDSIVLERGSKISSQVWKHLMKSCSMQLKLSTRRPPLSNGASEIMNCMGEICLR